MKRRLFLLLLMPVLWTACTSHHYQIDGIFPSDDGTPVWLIDLSAKDTLARTAVLK